MERRFRGGGNTSAFVCLSQFLPSEMFPTEESGVSDCTVAHFSLAAANTRRKMVTLLRRESELHGLYATARGLAWGTVYGKM